MDESTETTTETTTETAAPQEVEFPEHDLVLEGNDGVERIVHDTDENGDVTGWHKEAVGKEG